jgi:hypothetical protein
MGYKQSRNRTAFYQGRKLRAQSLCQSFIKGNERFIKQQQSRVDRKCSRQRNAARKPERKFAGIVQIMRLQIQNFE